MADYSVGMLGKWWYYPGVKNYRVANYDSEWGQYWSYIKKDYCFDGKVHRLDGEKESY